MLSSHLFCSNMEAVASIFFTVHAKAALIFHSGEVCAVGIDKIKACSLPPLSHVVESSMDPWMEYLIRLPPYYIPLTYFLVYSFS